MTTTREQGQRSSLWAVANSAAALLHLLLSTQTLLAAELPVLPTAATLSGNATTASFRGGVSSNNGQSYSSSFYPNDTLDISGEISPETAHINNTGNLYIIIETGGAYFYRDQDNIFQPWNLDLQQLQATSQNKTLEENEPLLVLDDVALGPFGLANTSMSIYLAYNTTANPEELYFSSTAIELSIANYDPLRIASNSLQILDTTVLDSDRNREIPALVYLPESTEPSPVILFSHGLGGNRFTAEYLGEHWSSRGYLVVFLQHPGSDESILDVPAGELLQSFMDAASFENSVARVQDVSAVLDQLELWNTDPLHSLNQRMNMDVIGMAGHSFGARTTKAVSGQKLSGFGFETRDSRIKAAVILSPSPPDFPTPEIAFADVDIPWLLMTGTLDDSNVTDITPEDRLLVYPALPEGGKYELVLYDGEHHAFTDRPLNAGQEPRNPAHHPEIQALSTAFWDSWLLQDVSARLWLDGNDALSVQQAQDSWKLK